ncbi:PREDICTED: protein N-lysine methyltransferase METTL20-like isoform X1 [Dinoponera quadriceps]|uniref:ETFB lysine methyltransferase n=1 Tax=Dinoponera quadriceps TaxID=609295 RepID=A0A6P3WR86_DINQU|nr:PREDICTED: protein N-lysine methyltransferase METTL20-like isoform X1 [Dinoponera quadriceps]XP_014468586.1 PREDICTED: protein N-lysine methyltransferase METTL20-like isoform X1 [Dinoponera quadriceps]
MIVRSVACLKKRLIARKFSRSTKDTWDHVLRNSHGASLKGLTESRRDVVRTILNNTEVSHDHMTPELKLFLLTENCPLYREPFLDKDGDRRLDSLTRTTFQDPFWSIYWPGGQVLGRFILDERERIFGRRGAKGGALRILDLGAGCGAAAIAAKSIGPWQVVANDINEVACVAIAMNAMLNDVDIEVSWENLLKRPPEDLYDMIFVGDLLYDEEITNILITWLENAHARGARIYLGDPGRHGLTENLKKRLRLLRRYSLPENVKRENHGYDTATVWEFAAGTK